MQCGGEFVVDVVLGRPKVEDSLSYPLVGDLHNWRFTAASKTVN